MQGILQVACTYRCQERRINMRDLGEHTRVSRMTATRLRLRLPVGNNEEYSDNRRKHQQHSTNQQQRIALRFRLHPSSVSSLRLLALTTSQPPLPLLTLLFAPLCSRSCLFCF